MKLLTFAFILAFILQDYGTHQAKPFDDCLPNERAPLFNKYASDLVNAVAEPLRQNKLLMAGGSECFRAIEQKSRDTNSVSAILAIMSIVNDYYDNFQAVRQNSEISPSEITDGLMDNMGKIFFVLENATDKSPVIFLDDVLESLKAYTSAHKPRHRSRHSPGASEYDEIIQSAKKCYRTMVSINHGPNEAFFKKLTAAFEIASALVRAGDEIEAADQRWTDLSAICSELSAFWLSTDMSDFEKAEAEELDGWLRRA